VIVTATSTALVFQREASRACTSFARAATSIVRNERRIDAALIGSVGS
jgi:hypothetical protein